MKKLKFRSDHIGLYPRKGEASKESDRPLIYILTIPEEKGDLAIPNDHPLSAPIKKQLSDGSPGGSWRYIVAKKGESMFVFGSINKSIGNRLLFFPSNYHISPFHNEKPKLLDHISFEFEPKFSSHYTFRDSSHASNGKLKKIDENLVLWFTLLINNFNEYILLPNKIKISLDWPSSDISRFSKEGVLANYKSESIIDIPSIIDETHFHQIDFFVGSNEIEYNKIPNVIFENINKFDQPKEPAAGIAKIDVNDMYSLFIKIVERKGSIKNDSLIMSSELFKKKYFLN